MTENIIEDVVFGKVKYNLEYEDWFTSKYIEALSRDISICFHQKQYLINLNLCSLNFGLYMMLLSQR